VPCIPSIPNDWLSVAGYAPKPTDCIIAVGARFDDRITGNLDKFCPYAKIIHIDIDPSSVGKTVGVDVAIIGQVNDALNALIQALKDQKLVNIVTHPLKRGNK
jgi:acetolactate synthase-1/2/3 large subunit